MTATIAERYREFAAQEARGRSPLYEQFAEGIAGDADILALLATLPEEKQQPNLILAAARYLAGPAADFAGFRRTVLDRRDEVLAVVQERRTQTNEPARTAALYPLLADLPQPLALLEVGASAGLCLLPDRYRYEYNDHPAGDLDSPVVLRSRVEGPARRPGPITVTWRAGIDLNPLDVTDPDDVRWLDALVWPGDHDRRERLRHALTVARRDPPRVVRGDLNERFDEVVAQAPTHATLVVCHTAVLWYLTEAERARFRAKLKTIDCHWIAQEAPGVHPGLSADRSLRSYLVTLDEQPMAYSAPHGGWLRWLT